MKKNKSTKKKENNRKKVKEIFNRIRKTEKKIVKRISKKGEFQLRKTME